VGAGSLRGEMLAGSQRFARNDVRRVHSSPMR
jgi:hypothetical protein